MKLSEIINKFYVEEKEPTLRDIGMLGKEATGDIEVYGSVDNGNPTFFFGFEGLGVEISLRLGGVKGLCIFEDDGSFSGLCYELTTKESFSDLSVILEAEGF